MSRSLNHFHWWQKKKIKSESRGNSKAGIIPALLLTLSQVGVLHVSNPPGASIVAVPVHQHLGLLRPVVAAAQNALAVVADEELVEVVVAGVVPRPQVETGNVFQLCREISSQTSL